MIQTDRGNIVDPGFFNARALRTLYVHNHSRSRSAPRLGNPLTVSTTSSVWNEFYASQMTEIWSAGDAPTKSWDMHWAVISDINALGDYLLGVFVGESGSEVEVSTLPFYRDELPAQEGSLPVQMAIQAKGQRLAVALSSGNNAVNTCNIRIQYHEYDD